MGVTTPNYEGTHPNAPNDLVAEIPTNNEFLKVGIRNSAFSTAGYLINIVISLLFAGLTIRYLGFSRAGFLMTLQAVLGANSVLGDFGLSIPLSRRLAFFISRRRFRYARRILGTIIVTNSTSSTVISLLVIVTFPWIFHYSKIESEFYADAKLAAVLAALQFILLQPSNVLRSTYTSCQRYDLYHGTSVFINTGANLLRLVVLIVIPTMTAVTAAGLLATVATILFDMLLLQRLIHGIPYPTLLWREVRQALGFGAWNWASNLAQFFYGSVDRVILTAYLGAGALPYYALPQRFVEQIHGLLAGQFHYLFPYLSSLGKASHEIIRQVDDRARWLLALLAAVLYGSLALLGQPLLAALVGSEFAMEASLPLQLACIQGLFMAQVIFNYYATWSQNEAKVNALYDLISYAGSCLLALALIPPLGVAGAAMGKLMVVPLFFFHLYHSRRTLKLSCNVHALLAPYALPLALFAFLMLMQWPLTSYAPDMLWRTVLAALLLPLGCATAWLVEMSYFQEYQRHEILTRLLATAWGWVKGCSNRTPV